MNKYVLRRFTPEAGDVDLMTGNELPMLDEIAQELNAPTDGDVIDPGVLYHVETVATPPMLKSDPAIVRSEADEKIAARFKRFMSSMKRMKK